MDSVDGAAEDFIYDSIEKVCQNENLFEQYSILENLHLVQKENDDQRRTRSVEETENDLWQKKVMQQACEDSVKSQDDDLKEYVLAYIKTRSYIKGHKRYTKEADERWILMVCQEIKLCGKKSLNENFEVEKKDMQPLREEI